MFKFIMKYIFYAVDRIQKRDDCINFSLGDTVLFCKDFGYWTDNMSNKETADQNDWDDNWNDQFAF